MQPHPERHVSATICFVHSPVRVRHVLSWYVGLEARCAHAMSALFLLCSPMSVGTSLPSHAAARLQAVFAVGCTHKERTTARARGCADSSKVKRAGRTVVILCVRARVLCACLFFFGPVATRVLSFSSSPSFVPSCLMRLLCLTLTSEAKANQCRGPRVNRLGFFLFLDGLVSGCSFCALHFSFFFFCVPAKWCSLLLGGDVFLPASKRMPHSLDGALSMNVPVLP